MTGYVIYNTEGVNPLVINTLFELPEVKGTFFYLDFGVFSVFFPLIFFFFFLKVVSFSVLSENILRQFGVRREEEHASSLGAQIWRCRH